MPALLILKRHLIQFGPRGVAKGGGGGGGGGAGGAATPPPPPPPPQCRVRRHNKSVVGKINWIKPIGNT